MMINPSRKEMATVALLVIGVTIAIRAILRISRNEQCPVRPYVLPATLFVAALVGVGASHSVATPEDTTHWINARIDDLRIGRVSYIRIMGFDFLPTFVSLHVQLRATIWTWSRPPAEDKRNVADAQSSTTRTNLELKEGDKNVRRDRLRKYLDPRTSARLRNSPNVRDRQCGRMEVAPAILSHGVARKRSSLPHCSERGEISHNASPHPIADQTHRMIKQEVFSLRGLHKDAYSKHVQSRVRPSVDFDSYGSEYRVSSVKARECSAHATPRNLHGQMGLGRIYITKMQKKSPKPKNLMSLTSRLCPP